MIFQDLFNLKKSNVWDVIEKEVKLQEGWVPLAISLKRNSEEHHKVN